MASNMFKKVMNHRRLSLDNDIYHSDNSEIDLQDDLEEDRVSVENGLVNARGEHYYMLRNKELEVEIEKGFAKFRYEIDRFMHKGNFAETLSEMQGVFKNKEKKEKKGNEERENGDEWGGLH